MHTHTVSAISAFEFVISAIKETQNNSNHTSFGNYYAYKHGVCVCVFASLVRGFLAFSFSHFHSQCVFGMLWLFVRFVLDSFVHSFGW